MNWTQLITDILLAVAVPCVTILTKSIVEFVKKKAEAVMAEKKVSSADEIERHIKIATDGVQQAVEYVAQTYVDGLKGKNAFDREAQRAALDKAKEAALRIISLDTQTALDEVYNFNVWLETKIEQTCRNLKKEPAQVEAAAATTAASVAASIATTAVQQIQAEAGMPAEEA